MKYLFKLYVIVYALPTTWCCGQSYDYEYVYKDMYELALEHIVKDTVCIKKLNDFKGIIVQKMDYRVYIDYYNLGLIRFFNKKHLYYYKEGNITLNFFNICSKDSLNNFEIYLRQNFYKKNITEQYFNNLSISLSIKFDSLNTNIVFSYPTNNIITCQLFFYRGNDLFDDLFNISQALDYENYKKDILEINYMFIYDDYGIIKEVCTY